MSDYQREAMLRNGHAVRCGAPYFDSRFSIPRTCANRTKHASGRCWRHR